MSDAPEPDAPPRRLTTVDAHAAGEPLRIVTAGFPDPPGSTMLDKRAYAIAHLDHLRRVLVWEPRGHADMYGCVPTAPVTADGDVGLLFLHNEGFSTMCGHGIIAYVTVAVAAGWFPATSGRRRLRIDTPAGRVEATAHLEGNRVTRVTFRNVPSFVLVADLSVAVPGLGTVSVDLAYGGAFYAYVAAEPLGLALVPAAAGELIEVGRRITAAVAASHTVHHPGGGDGLDFLYGTIFVGPAEDRAAHSRNVCVFADGEVDRSPTGTGVSGRLALHHRRGELATGDTITVESLLGTTFTGRVADTTTVGSFPAVVPEIGGRAWITGRHEFEVDPADPLGGGFLIR